MRAPLYQVDAFTRTRFAGNPAAVVVLDAFPDDREMLAIAAENNQSETAFLVGEQLRWFTPAVEIPLCGHATLATAWVVLERLEPARASVTFATRSGPLQVRRHGDGFAMDFPSRPTEPASHARDAIAAALGVAPEEVRVHETQYLAVLRRADDVRALAPDLAAVARLDRPGLIVTAPGDGEHDCVSRYFAPQRGGELACRLDGDRVELAGGCVPYLEGHIAI